jgi:hypothetical protein
VPPIYQPEIAAKGVVFAADHPRRKQYWVGGTTAATVLASRIAPGLLDRYLARTGYSSQETGEPTEPGRPDNLDAPLDNAPGTDHGAHGGFDDKSHHRSLQQWLSEHERLAVGGATAAAAIAAGSVLALRR